MSLIFSTIKLKYVFLHYFRWFRGEDWRIQWCDRTAGSDKRSCYQMAWPCSSQGSYTSDIWTLPRQHHHLFCPCCHSLCGYRHGHHIPSH